MYRYSNPNRLPVQAVVAAWKWFVRKRAVRLPIGAVELQLKVRGTLSREAADRLHITADGLAPMTAWFNWVFPSLATLRARQTTSKGCIMTGTRAAHPSVEERRARGKLARKQATPDSHVGWRPAPDRPDPLGLLKEQDATREADLVPVRHGRMMVSPFTFYRGSAKIMAADLDGTPTAGLNVQLCGDAHLSNFGVFASPERTLLFDLNDFDETLPGPFEYDVKRLATSFTIAGRNNRFSKSDARTATSASVTAYREAMAEFATMGVMQTWYARLSEDDVLNLGRAATVGNKKQKTMLQSAQKELGKAHTRDSLQALSQLAEDVGGQYRIISQPPIVIPARDLAEVFGSAEQVMKLVEDQLRAYRTTLPEDKHQLLDSFELVDVARKVVGVGSVGTRAFIGLLQGRDKDDPLFLQVKEATSSVLEDHLPKSRYRNHGQRVVEGQRKMQAASDIFLGWTKGVDANRDYYWRQLRDMKGSADIEAMMPIGMTTYARACGWTLARAHARSGDAIAIAAYLGKSDRFDRSITEFSQRYANQNEQDYEQFTTAIRSGALSALEGV
jgi:uncharacterized protein (DUF2252 family)